MEVHMSRQLDVQQEIRESTRRDTLIKAIEFGIVGALESQGMTFRGFSIKYRDFDCFMVVKAKVDDRWMIAYVASDSIMNCLLKSYQEARSETLSWSKDKYQPSDA